MKKVLLQFSSSMAYIAAVQNLIHLSIETDPDIQDAYQDNQDKLKMVMNPEHKKQFEEYEEKFILDKAKTAQP